MSKATESHQDSDSNFMGQYAQEPLTTRNSGKQKYYKPFVLWTPTLSVLLGITVILFALVEFACQKLPNAENHGLVGNLENSTGLLDKLLPRQVTTDLGGDPAPTPPAVLTPIYSATTEVSTISGIEYSYEYTLSLIPETTDTANTASGPQSTGGPKKDNWLKIGTRTINPPSAPTPDPNPIQTPVNPVIVNPENPSPGNPSPANPGPTVVNGSPVGVTSAIPTIVAAPSVTPATFVPVATTMLDTLGNAVTTTVPVAIDSAGNTLTIPSGMILVDATTTRLVKPTTSSKTGTKNGSSDSSNSIVHIFTKQDYIVGAFIPTIVAVLFAIPWGLIDAAAKEMEPIYQMAATGGASASNSLVLNYASASMFIAPFQAFNRRHWIIFITSILSLLSLLSAPLAVESIFISLRGTCNADTDSLNCIPTLSVFKKAARVLEAVLIAMAILLALLICLARKRSSAVLAEPISLAGVASLMHNQEFLNIVRELPSYGIKEKALLGLLPPAHYTIGHYQNNDGTRGYGFMLSRDSPVPNASYNSNTYANVNLHNQGPSDDELSLNNKLTGFWARFFRLVQVFGFLLFLIGIGALIAYYRFVETEHTGFGRFMSNQAFGVKFMFTSLGVIIAQFWAYAREKIHRNEPYHSLTTLSSPPRKSILTSPALAPITSIYTSITLLSPVLILLDISTLLADALIITLSNVPYSSATTFEAWTVCSYMSLAIVAFMILTLIVVLVRIGRFGAAEGGGEVPVSVVGKAVLMCGSGMLEKFEGLGEVRGKERKKRIEGWGKVYGIGRVRGVDGNVRRGVDFGEYVEGR